MPRALTELRRAMPGVTLYPEPVLRPQAGFLGPLVTLRLTAEEYTKYLLALAGLTTLFPGPRPGTAARGASRMIILRSALFNVCFFGSTLLLTLAGTVARFVAPHRILDFAAAWARLLLWGARVICGIRLGGDRRAADRRGADRVAP